MSKDIAAFDFFDAIYCINLKERKDRLAHSYLEFESLGITDKVIIFDAIKNETACNGCRDSHIEIIRQAKEKGLKNILVLEDDIFFLEKDSGYYNSLFKAAKSLPEFNLLYLSANTLIRLERENEYLFKAKECLTTHSICYNHSIFDTILNDYDNDNVGIIDQYLKNIIQPMNKSYIASRLCTTQRGGYSDIEREYVDYDFMIYRFNHHTRSITPS